MARPRETTDDELLARVESALAKRAWSRWSLAEVAGEVGVAAATLVKRFGSRKGLLEALSRRWVASIPEQPTTADPRRELAGYVQRSFAPIGVGQRAVAGMELLLEDLADPDLRALLREGWDRQIAYLARLLAAADLSRLGDPTDAARTLFDSLQGAQLRGAAGGTGPGSATPKHNLDRLLEAWT